MVGHPASNQLMRMPESASRGAIVRRFVETVTANPSQIGHLSQIAERSRGVCGQGKKCRVWRNYHAIDLGLVERKLGKTEWVIFVVACIIQPMASRFGNAPRDALAGGISLLRTHCRNTRAFQQGIRIGLHPKRGHQVPEQRSSPREQYRTTAVERMPAAKKKPTLLVNVFLRDSNKHCRAGLGSEEVVASGMKLLRFHIEAHRHQLTPTI